MNPSMTQAVRLPLSEFSQVVGKRVLHFRLYRQSEGFLCERELIEPDGTGTTQALPCETVHQVEEFIESDPHYREIKRGANKLLHNLELEVRHEHSSSG